MNCRVIYSWHRPNEAESSWLLYDRANGDLVGTVTLLDNKFVLRHGGYMLGRFNSTQGAEEALEKWINLLRPE